MMDCWKLEVGCWMLDVGCWMLDVGCWKLEVGCWMLDVGCWMLDVGCWMFHQLLNIWGKSIIYFKKKEANLSITVGGSSDCKIEYAVSRELIANIEEVLNLIKI